MAEDRIAALEAFLKGHPSIKYTFPSSPDYDSVRELWYFDRQDVPLAIVHPQSANDVSILVRYAKSAGIPFTVRAGGHNVGGHSIVEGALTIDMRGLSDIELSSDRQSATVQGGALLGDVLAKLAEHKLATPTGVTPSVGYTGWAIYGGYGLFSGPWGLGVDQIIGATIVKPDGELIKANDALLKGIRGAGGVFGVIVDLTVKVYPLDKVLSGVILFDSQDISKTFTHFNVEYQKIADNIPLQLAIQQLAINGPAGPAFGACFMWISDDLEEGHRWLNKIAALGTVIQNTVDLVTAAEWITKMGELAPRRVYGVSTTSSVRELTPEVVEVAARHLAVMPSSPCTTFFIHVLRGPSAEPKSNSVFATRVPHFMFDILGIVSNKELRDRSVQWALGFLKEIQEVDAKNLLPTAYVSLESDPHAAPLSRYFGTHVEEILALKKEYDPDSTFELTVPRLQRY